jgi:succinate dehydrogenase / fumarate reductase membrane anchor subunit
MKLTPKPTSKALCHWRWQRISAVALIFLSSWFVVSLVTKLLHATPETLAQWLANPLVAGTLALTILAAYVHKHIGLHEIVTDYVHCGFKKRLTNFVLDAGALVLTIATLAAIWHLHTSAAIS